MKKLFTLALLLVASQFVFSQTAQVITDSVYCTGSPFLLNSYTIGGTFNSGNFFTFQLSDSSGSFANPVTLGSVTGTGGDGINTTIPANTPTGYHYLIRVVSSSPADTSHPNISTDKIHIITSIKAIISNDTSICAGMSVQLRASGGSSYNWLPGWPDMNCTSCPNPIATPSVTTTYIVTVSINNSCSPVSDTVVVNVNSTIGGTLTAVHDSVCRGNSATLLLNGNSPDAIQWQSSSRDSTFTNINGATNSTYTTGPLNETTWYRANIGLGASCPAATSDTLQIYVPPVPVAAFSIDQINGLTVYFDLSWTSTQTVRWNFGDGTATNNNSYFINHTFSNTGVYHVCLIAIALATCSDTTCEDIPIGQQPSCDAFFLLIPDNVVYGHWFALNQSKGKMPISYNWSWGDGATGIGDTASHIYASEGFYNICLTINDDTLCTSTFCDSSTYMDRLDGTNSMVTVNVVNSLPNIVPIITSSQKPLAINTNPCAYCVVTGSNNPADLEVSDVLGRKVNTVFTKASGGFNLSLPNNNTCIYFIRDNKTGQVVKFVKE